MLLYTFVVEWCKYLYHSVLTFDRYKRHRCPSCGYVGRMGMKFNPAYGKLILTCPRDSANWGITPLIPYGTWQLTGYEQYVQEQQESVLLAIQEREHKLINRR